MSRGPSFRRKLRNQWKWLFVASLREHGPNSIDGAGSESIVRIPRSIYWEGRLKMDWLAPIE